MVDLCSITDLRKWQIRSFAGLVNFGGEWWIWLVSGKRFFKKVDEMVKMVEGSGGYGKC